MVLVLGIDQGGSKTHALVSDLEGDLLGFGVSYGACHAFNGMESSMNAVNQAAKSALSQAAATVEAVQLVYGGFTGADWPDEYPLLVNAVRSLGLCQSVVVSNDCITALRGGTDKTYGAILIAGSGGNCAIRSPKGDEFIYGYFQEQGLQGGSALGRKALNAIYRAETGRAPVTRLTQRILELYGYDQVCDLLRADVENRLHHPEIKEITPIIFEEACQGDQAASQILVSFGQGYAELVTAGLYRLGMEAMDVDVVLSGGAFKGKGNLLFDTLADSIHIKVPDARLVNAHFEPVVGAVLLALETIGIQIAESLRQNIEHSAARLGLVRLIG